MPVYEQGYRHFEGERSVRLLRFAPIAANGFRLAMRSKFFLSLVVFPSQIAFVVGVVIVYVFFQRAPAILAEMGQKSFSNILLMAEFQSQIGPPLYWTLLTVQTGLFVPIVGAMLAGRLIAADAQSNALEVYFSRPITRFDYAFGKFLTAFGFLLYVTIVPPVGVWGVACLLAPDGSYFEATRSMGAGLALNAILVSSVSAVLLLGLSSASKKPRFAAALWIGAMIFSHVASQILLEAVRLPGAYLVSVFHNFQVLGYPLVSETLSGQIIRNRVPLPSPAACWSVLGAIVIVSLFLFVRRLRAVEIVR